jgi:phosphonate ABC transporter permease subunit PhnE
LEEARLPRRQEQFVRVLRALSRPDIIEYERDEVRIETPIFVPCPETDVTPLPVDQSGPYLVVTPPCAPPNSEILVEGFNFASNSSGPLNFIPPSNVTLQLGQFETDSQGHFSERVKLPRREPTPEIQHIRAITRTNVGRPHLTRTALDTWDKIIETVFLALLATTIGTALSIPVSFLAARNIMKDINSPLASVAMSMITWPAGLALGFAVARWISNLRTAAFSNVMLSLAGILAAPLILLGVMRLTRPGEELQAASRPQKILRILMMLAAGLVLILGLFLLASVAQVIGDFLVTRLGFLDFLARFLSNLGEILDIIISVVVALVFGAIMGSIGGKFGQSLAERLPAPSLKILNLVLAAVAGAILLALIGGIVRWLYLIENTVAVIWLPAAVGAILGLLVALRTRAKEPLPIGMSIYYVVRTVLNTLRSIEALIMAIVFVVLVSTGPFAGVLALSLHTVAALAKLYSEQVESILPGPLEAVKATGANRLQTIVYAVVPQIVPPYISFTMYRWDINVRMSTIIGFAGGGGIGFLLQQNINLLNYRAASVQMLAITIVVALMDYISSRLREKVV